MESQPSSLPPATEENKVSFEFAQLMGELTLQQRGIIMRELLRIYRQEVRVFHSFSVVLEVVQDAAEEEPHGE